MNLHSLKRQRFLGIENLNHFKIWAKMQRKQGNDTESVINLSKFELDYYNDSSQEEIDDTKRCVEKVIADYGSIFEDPGTRNTELKDTIQSVYYGAEKYEKFLYMIDIRPVSDFKVESDIYKTLDKISIDCGCNPIGQHWAEFKPELGKLTLRSCFEFNLTNKNYRDIEESEAERLALEFSKPFNNTVRYFCNAREYPWATNKLCSVNLQSYYDIDYGVILYDGTNIGMIVFAWYLY